jgi:hypothetical protein
MFMSYKGPVPGGIGPFKYMGTEGIPDKEAPVVTLLLAEAPTSRFTSMSTVKKESQEEGGGFRGLWYL